jgi:hypothetical protein
MRRQSYAVWLYAMNIRRFAAEVSLLLLSNEHFNGAGVYISTIVKDRGF